MPHKFSPSPSSRGVQYLRAKDLCPYIYIHIYLYIYTAISKTSSNASAKRHVATDDYVCKDIRESILFSIHETHKWSSLPSASRVVNLIGVTFLEISVGRKIGSFMTKALFARNEGPCL